MALFSFCSAYSLDDEDDFPNKWPNGIQQVRKKQGDVLLASFFQITAKQKERPLAS
jgi:hypothetical protein